MEEKHRILTDEVEKLEKESQTVIIFPFFPSILSLGWNELCTQLCWRVLCPPEQDRLMTKRMEKMKLQADLKKLQSYRASLDSFKDNLEKKDSELNAELEISSK